MRISLVSWLSFILFQWVCLSFHVFVASADIPVVVVPHFPQNGSSRISAHCLDDQKLLLLQMKNQLRFNSTYCNGLVFWNESLPCGEWSGVTWDEEGHVTGLDLRQCGLTGRFPKEIFQVHSLTSIDLSFNWDLQGSLPHFPLNASLQTLTLSSTSFSGALPDSISNLRQLSTLSISGCQFNGTLPYSMSTLTELTYLDLSFNDFTGPIPSFGMAKKLTHMDLSSNKLGGAISIVSSSMLRHLDISSNQFEGLIPQSIFHLKQLEYLQLSSNKFSGTIQLDMILGLENLTILGLSNNNLSIDVNVKYSHFFSIPKMASIHLASCKLREFPTFLRNQSELIDLDLSNNEIAEKVPNWIWELGKLDQLNLSHNLLQDIERPPNNRSSNFYILDLHQNNLEGTLPTFISAYYLDYSFNNFNSIIPPNIDDIQSSSFFFSVSHNALHGKIPDSICNVSKLQVLDLSFNNFNGMIPHCLAKSETLVVLNLERNNLSGNIPDAIRGPCALKTLDLSSNNLQGPIPKSLSKCTALEVLKLENNKIDDQFPCILEKLSELRVLVLRNNKFHGPIGCSKTQGIWAMLRILDLSFNIFNGTLLGTSFLTWKAMMLDKGMLNDVHFKPVDFDPLKPFHFVFFQSIEMKYQDYVMVTFKGQEMSLSKILSIHTFIDLSSNHFVGPIPEEMMEFRALHGLNMSNNHLTGHIPSSIWKMKQLESLDLSKNSFTGEIPSQLASLSFLSFVNLSYNHLFGEIPTGTQIQSFPASSFVGNSGLCGPPLTKNCSGVPRNPTEAVYEKSGIEFDWRFAFGGAVFGLGIIVGPLFYWKNWRIRYWKLVNNILCSIFPQLYLEYQRHQGQTYEVLRWRH